MPSAPGVSTASLAHGQRRGQARHSALISASSAAPVAHRYGSRVHGIIVRSISSATVIVAPPTEHQHHCRNTSARTIAMQVLVIALQVNSPEWVLVLWTP